MKNKKESEAKISIPLKIDGTKDFSVVKELIQNYENHRIQERELSEEERSILEEYYFQRNRELVYKIKYRLQKIERLKQKIGSRANG